MRPAKGWKDPQEPLALQSIVIGAPEIDTAQFDTPDGLLKRFQNTGVESRWHLVLPAVRELKRQKGRHGRDKAWRETATRHFEVLSQNLDEIEFEVTFSGRW
ncbi:hypothetical protein [Breoghania sp.]|uniref:hypothetical protein n=1 Tax=Breoghania sp. TaxID=2065378 RepID=UPI00261FC1E9|nr:hypothetical protein [Breoghania sp.]MDJ0933689.1 hypothetical protein [Breoghania sp.]